VTFAEKSCHRRMRDFVSIRGFSEAMLMSLLQRAMGIRSLMLEKPGFDAAGQGIVAFVSGSQSLKSQERSLRRAAQFLGLGFVTTDDRREWDKTAWELFMSSIPASQLSVATINASMPRLFREDAAIIALAADENEESIRALEFLFLIFSACDIISSWNIAVIANGNPLATTLAFALEELGATHQIFVPTSSDLLRIAFYSDSFSQVV
jgi:hypothetical protein